MWWDSASTNNILYPFLYPFEMLQQYYFKMYFMIMVTKLVIKLCGSVNFCWFWSCLLSNVLFSDVTKRKQNLNKNAFCKCVGHCIVRFVIPQGCFVKKGLWAVTLAGYLKTDSLQQLLSFYSVFLACQKCSTRALAVYVSHVCSVFLCFVSSFTTEQQKRLSSLAGMMWKVCYPPAAASAGAKLVLW